MVTRVTNPAPANGLRERHKRRRRGAILDAVRALLRDGGEVELTKDRIAARAEVAPATVYNLVGTRARLWEALASDFMDALERRLDEEPVADPVSRLRQIIALTVDLFVADPLVSTRMLRGWEASGGMLRRAPTAHIVAALERAASEGVLERDLEPRVLAASIATGCLGALHQWAAGMIDDDKLHARSLLSADIALAAAASAGHRDRLSRALRRRRGATRGDA